MDIRQWGVGRIMQLPDWCFGSRWMVSCAAQVVAASDYFDIVDTGVPDRCVVWELIVTSKTALESIIWINFAWGDQLPANLAAWQPLQKMFPGQGYITMSEYCFECGPDGGLALRRLRLPSPASGQRPCIRIVSGSTTGAIVTAYFVISSLPTEVPDWIVSG